MTRVAVMASGSGSNLQALLDAEAAGRLSAHIELVVSNRQSAGALERARAANRDAVHLSPSRYASESDYCARFLKLLAEHRIEVICLAGYLKKLPAQVVRAFAGRVLNIHPAPLPEFGGPGMYGHHVHAAVLAAGATKSGPTVHFVDEGFDTGPIAAHVEVAVLPGDTPETLAARVLTEEHKLYPRVLEAVVSGRLRLEKGRVVGALNA